MMARFRFSDGEVMICEVLGREVMENEGLKEEEAK